jgi:hypothetical protein
MKGSKARKDVRRMIPRVDLTQEEEDLRYAISLQVPEYHSLPPLVHRPANDIIFIDEDPDSMVMILNADLKRRRVMADEEKTHREIARIIASELPTVDPWDEWPPANQEVGDDYEQLLELDKNNVVVKVSEEVLTELPTFPYKATMASQDPCRICLEEYEEGDMLRGLSCFHNFHQACIDQWLNVSKKCPVCKHDVSQ